MEPWDFLDPKTGDAGCLDLGPALPTCPDGGMTCFDDFPRAFLTCFKMITTEGWSTVMWFTQDSAGTVVGAIYSVSLVVLVSFNLVNIFLASISSSYRIVKEARLEVKEVKKARRRHYAQHSETDLRQKNQSSEEEVNEKNDKAATDTDETPFYMRLIDSLRPAARRPLNRVSHVCRRVVTYPQVIDECGQTLQPEILGLAEERNLDFQFGPELGHWRLINRVHRKGDDEEFDIIPGHSICSGVSLDPDRKELRQKILEVAPVRSEANIFSNEIPYPWLDMFVIVCICANMITIALDEFDGTIIDTLPGFLPSDNCCNADCTVRDSYLCPRSILMQHQRMNEELDKVEVAFCVIFSVEQALRVIAVNGILGHVLEQFPFNLYDFSIVIVSDAVLIARVFVQSNTNINVFRIMRILRTVRLIRSLGRFSRMRDLLKTAYRALVSAVYVLVVLVFWTIVSALIAMQLFACKVKTSEECQFIDGACPTDCSDLIGNPPECVFNKTQIFANCPWDEDYNFNTFLNSVVAIMYVTTAEDWDHIMNMGMKSYSSNWVGLIFFIFCHVVGSYLLLNLFLGAILEEFEVRDDVKEAAQLRMFRVQVLKEIIKMRRKRRRSRDADVKQVLLGTYRDFANEDDKFAEEADENSHLGLFLEESNEKINYVEDPPIFWGWLKPPHPDFFNCPDEPKNLRAHVRHVLLNAWFDRIILLSILASAVILAMDSPLEEDRILDPEQTLKSDYVFLAIFLLEFVLKILDRGIYWESKCAYFRSSWNILDFIILMSQILEASGTVHLNITRSLRLLRPLRLFTKVKSLQLLLGTLQACTMDLLNVLAIWIFAYFIFAIFGVHLFSGKLHACSDSMFVGGHLNPSESIGSQVGWRENCVGNYFQPTNEDGHAYASDSKPTPILQPRVWRDPIDKMGFSFDTFGDAMQSLFELSTLEHWADYTHSLQAITSIGQQPIIKHSSINVLYVFAWLFISRFFIMQLVVGVLMRSMKRTSGRSVLTAVQRKWKELEPKLQLLKPWSIQTGFPSRTQEIFWRAVNGRMFRQFYTVVVLSNILILASEYYNQPVAWAIFIHNIDWVFIGLYVVEIICNFLAYGFSFFHDAWNWFDVFVVTSAFIGATNGESTGLNSFRGFRLFRLVKVLRTFKLLRRMKNLRNFILGFIKCLPQILSTAVLLSMLIFLFGILGMQYFSSLGHRSGINRHNNFKNAWNSWLLLFRVLTGENWQIVFRDCTVEPPMCTPDVEVQLLLGNPTAQGNCGNRIFAYFFFDVFFFLGNKLLLTFFITVLLDSFTTIKMNFVLSEDHLVSYQRIWRDLDPLGRGEIPIWKLKELLERLHLDNNPLGLSMLASEIKFRCVRIELLENSCDDAIKFEDVVATLALHAVGAHGLPFIEMLKRQEKLSYYSQLAAVGQIAVKFKMAKLLRRKDEGIITKIHTEGTSTTWQDIPVSPRPSLSQGASLNRGGEQVYSDQCGLRRRRNLPSSPSQGDFQGRKCQSEEDEKLLEQLILEETKHVLQRSEQMKTWSTGFDGHKWGQAGPHPASSVAEICLASLPDADLDRTIADLDAMLTSVNDDPYLSVARVALAQLTQMRSRTPSRWPVERPTHR
jgi:hypothetical protein